MLTSRTYTRNGQKSTCKKENRQKFKNEKDFRNQLTISAFCVIINKHQTEYGGTGESGLYTVKQRGKRDAEN